MTARPPPAGLENERILSWRPPACFGGDDGGVGFGAGPALGGAGCSLVGDEGKGLPLARDAARDPAGILLIEGVTGCPTGTIGSKVQGAKGAQAPNRSLS